MGFSDKIVCVGDFFGIELFVLKTGKERNAEYREENKEKFNNRDKKYREENKEKNKLYREKNKEKLKKYREDNKEKIKEYNQSPQGKKTKILSSWKCAGVLHDNFDELYTIYLNCTNCMVCDKEFKNTKDRHLDHSHETGLYRNVLCCACNTRDNWIKVLKNKELK